MLSRIGQRRARTPDKGAGVPALPRVLRVALILILPAMLPALAYASPTDPSWIPGIYDAADYDDVVVLVTSGTGHAAPTVEAVRPGAPSPEGLPELAERVTPALSPSPVHPRAPPAS
jgi:hypothetical protein